MGWLYNRNVASGDGIFRVHDISPELLGQGTSAVDPHRNKGEPIESVNYDSVAAISGNMETWRRYTRDLTEFAWCSPTVLYSPVQVGRESFRTDS